MKKNIISIMSVIVVLIIVSVIIYPQIDKKDNSKNKATSAFSANTDLTMEICKDKNNCKILKDPVYITISLDTKNKELQNIIDQINEETKRRYDKALESTLDSPSCSAVRNMYNYSYISVLDYNLYENNDYITISLTRNNTDLCTNESTIEKPEIYIYSKKQDKIINQEIFKKELKVLDEEIKSSIQITIDNMNRASGTNYVYDTNVQELMLYYRNDGALCVYFYQNETNSYNSALIYEAKK